MARAVRLDPVAPVRFRRGATRHPLPFALLLLTMLGLPPTTALAIPCWQTWEATLGPDGSAGTGPGVDVEFTDGASTFRNPAFDDGSGWKVRAAFPTPGTWTWKAIQPGESSGEALLSTGTVEVTPSTGDHPLFSRGFLEVEPGSRFLRHADGTPFLWIGDTFWRAPQAASDEEWLEALLDRRDRGYTVVQIGPYTVWNEAPNPPNRAGERPWIEGKSRINPAYWDELSRRIRVANDLGLVVVVVGLPGWQRPHPTLTPDEREAFAREVAGRLAGSFVIVSGGADEGYGGLPRDLGKRMARLLPRHLSTHHPGTIANEDDSTNRISEETWNEPHLDFVMIQTGHNGGDRDACYRRARAWVNHLRCATPPRAIANAEAFYEGDPASGRSAYRGTAHDVRALGYLSMLSGSFGYTAGVLGLWNWGMIPDGAVEVDWRTALARDSAVHVGHLARFFGAIAWWELEPAPERVLDLPTEDTRVPVFARNAAGTLAVAYLPQGDSIVLDLSGIPGALQANWMNPQDGSWTSVSDRVPAGGPVRMSAPAAGGPDWLLLLQDPSAEAPTTRP